MKKNDKVLIRTLTYFLTGKITKIENGFVHLKEAAWIGDTGRFANAIKNGTLSEIEPVETCEINLQNIIDVFPWKHPLPREQK